jgi:hypothetical protein
MNSSTNDFSQNIMVLLRPALPGLLLTVITILFGFGVGIVFGLNEDLIKSRLNASALVVFDAEYHGDAKEMKVVLDKSWTYMKRAHLHAGAIGSVALGLILLVSLLGTKPILTTGISLGLGLGGLGYSVFWLWAGFLAPGLGSTGAAKEALRWLAMPSSGAVVASTAAVAIILAIAILKKNK